MAAVSPSWDFPDGVSGAEMAYKILIVDDEELIRWSLSEDLSSAGYKTLCAEDASSAASMLVAESPDIVLTDLRFAPGGGTGLDVLRAAQRVLGPVDVLAPARGFDNLPDIITALRQPRNPARRRAA